MFLDLLGRIWPKWAERRAFADAPIALELSGEAARDGDEALMWALLPAALFVPTALPWTPEMAAHLRRVLAFLQERSEGRLSSRRAKALRTLDRLLARGQAPRVPRTVRALASELRAFVSTRGLDEDATVAWTRGGA